MLSLYELGLFVKLFILKSVGCGSEYLNRKVKIFNIKKKIRIKYAIWTITKIGELLAKIVNIRNCLNSRTESLIE